MYISERTKLLLFQPMIGPYREKIYLMNNSSYRYFSHQRVHGQVSYERHMSAQQFSTAGWSAIDRYSSPT